MSLHLPYTPRDIARQSIDAAEAGAAILHLHARDPDDGRPTADPEVFMQFLPQIRESCDGDNAYFDRDWNQLPFINTKKQSTVPAPLPRPPQLGSLIAAAESLGRDIDHIRADLYLVRGHPCFGEITV